MPGIDSLHDKTPLPIEQEHPLWARDHIELKSVGIDIGSSTSHLVFSTLELRRQGAALSSRFQIASRRIDYESPILITPFVNNSSIDTEKLSSFFSGVYEESGMSPDDVDTGAVITTGDAARKDNAEAIVHMFSQQAGKFVCASAGPVLEAKMAAYGSGAVARSCSDGQSLTVMNVDVGGGTVKIAVAQNGSIVDTAAMNVGARLVVFDDRNVLSKMEKAAQIVSQHKGLGLQVGHPIAEETKRKLSHALARSLTEVVARRPLSPLTMELMITGPLAYGGKVDLILFSGGVSEYIYEKETKAYGDLGSLLAEEIRTQVASAVPDIPVETPVQRIRATVIGASQYTVQVSGNTIFIANPDLLPLRNLQVVAVRFDGNSLTPEGISRAITDSLHRCEIQEGEATVALALHWPWGPAYPLLRALCLGLVDSLRTTIKNRGAVILVLDSDIARLVGNNLSRELPGYRDLICIDGVQLQDLDYIDISKELVGANVVSVAIKSLVFSG